MLITSESPSLFRGPAFGRFVVGASGFETKCPPPMPWAISIRSSRSSLMLRWISCLSFSSWRKVSCRFCSTSFSCDRSFDKKSSIPLCPWLESKCGNKVSFSVASSEFWMLGVEIIGITLIRTDLGGGKLVGSLSGIFVAGDFFGSFSRFS